MCSLEQFGLGTCFARMDKFHVVKYKGTFFSMEVLNGLRYEEVGTCSMFGVL